jgi:hypothetical protein
MGGFMWIYSMLITSCCCIIIILSVVKLAIATGHAMQVSNDLHYSNRCRFISIACIWPVAMASLPLNTVQCLYQNTKSGFVPIIVLMPPSRLPISQNNRTICWWGDNIYLLTFLIVCIIEKYNTLWNVVTQPDEYIIYMNVGR